jgi:glycosyltransferase involved in cell wall biosynthesis
MRILLLTGRPHPFSTAFYRKLAEQPDIEITQVMLPAKEQAQKQPSVASDSPKPHILPAEIASIGSADDPHRVYIKPIHLYLKQTQPDLVVCQFEQESFAAAQAAIACSTLKPAVPLTLYSWQNVLRRRSLALRIVDFITLRRAMHITCANTEAVDVLRQKGFRGTTNIAPLVGVDVHHFDRCPEDKIQAMRAQYHIEGFAIGYAGRLVREKGVDTLMDAFAKLSIPSTLAIIGSGGELSALQHHAQLLGISNRCRFIGNVEYEAMPAHMSMLDVLVLPSRTTSIWKEQFGRVLAEAMACGVPVIGSISGAIPEVIGDAGMVFTEDDSHSLAHAITRMMGNDVLRKTYSQHGLARVLKAWTVEAISTQTAQVWRELAGAHDRNRNA